MKANSLQQLYLLIKHNCFQAVEWTSEKNSWRWIQFWSLLVGYGMRFEKDDLKKLEKFCEKHIYRSSGCYPPGDNHYSQAVIVGNTSFAVAYETYHNRKPFFFKGIDYDTGRGRIEGYRKGTQEKTQGRLILGCKFPWKGELVTVTSFNDIEQSLIACSYHLVKDDGEKCNECGGWKRYPSDRGSKIKKRFTITPEDLREALKEAKDK